MEWGAAGGVLSPGSGPHPGATADASGVPHPGLALAGGTHRADLGSVVLMGRHTPGALGDRGNTVELTLVAASAPEPGRGRHRAAEEVAGRASWRAHWRLDSPAGKRRAVAPRTHRSTPMFQTLALVGIGAFMVATVPLGTSGVIQLDTRPAERPDGTWVTVRPGSLSGAPGGRWVTAPAEARPSSPLPSSRPARSATSRSVLPAPGESWTRPAATTPSVSGSGSSPSPAADPSATTSTPVPAPGPTPVKKRCRKG